MGNEDGPDLFERSEDVAPNLRAVQCLDDPDYLCCAKVPDVKRGTCLPRVDDKSPYECLFKQSSSSEPMCPKEPENEHDILFRPVKWRCKRTRGTAEKQLEPSLGAPIGLSASTFSLNFLETKSTHMSLQGFATVLIGYAEYFITPEVEWDENVLNRILLEGQRLCIESNAKLPDGESLKESTIKRTFMLCGNAFHVLVNDPFLIGRVVGDEFPVPALHWGLAKFFKKFQFCLLQIGSWYVLLWTNSDVFFVFDCFGRRTEDFRSDRKRGLAALICLRTLENVGHLLLNLSGVRPDQLFTLRHLQLKSLIPCGGKPTPDIVNRTNQYEVIHADYAVLRATIHLGSHCFREVRHRHSLPVAIAALINAKIDATPLWDRAVLDKVLKLGAHLYKQWSHCDVSLDLGIQDVASQFVFGQFTVQIAVNAIVECGFWKCTPNYRHSDLSAALARAFDRGSNLILQIQGRSYAIWKKATFYFLLDPYSHQCSLGKEKLVTGSVRMCGGLDRLFCVVTQSLLDLFEESKFIIHLVKIVHLEELSMIKQHRRKASAPCMCLATPRTDALTEVASINESVLGPEDYVCVEEPPSVVDDSADLDSPGLSQTRLDDYTDLRRDFVEESESEEEDDSDLDLDIDDPGDDVRDDKSDVSDGWKPKKDKSVPKKVAKTKEKSAGGDADDKRDLKHDEEVATEEQPTTEEIIISAEEKTEEDEDEKSESTPQDQETANEDQDESKSDEPSRDEAPVPTEEIRTEPVHPPRQRRKKHEDDDSSSDEIPRCEIPAGCIPNAYPGFTEDLQDLAVVGSESGSYASLCSLLKSAFRCADRVLTMTPWGNYVAFHANQIFFIFDGCTCNLRSIRHLDLSVGTAGLLCFADMHRLICYIESGKDVPRPSKSTKQDVVDQICNEYCGR